MPVPGPGAAGTSPGGRRSPAPDEDRCAVPDGWANLDELAASPPVENVADAPVYRHRSLEETRSRELEHRRSVDERADKAETAPAARRARLATHVYTLSHLVFFSLLGTLARLGLVALTRYPGAPVIFSTVWANFAGCVVMGFLVEDRMLFRRSAAATAAAASEPPAAIPVAAADADAAKKAHLAAKKTLPLYIGLATGFCGSLTSFSAFVRDAFLAISNDLVAPGTAAQPPSRGAGDSLMAVLAVVATTVALALAGLVAGAHVAIAAGRAVPSLSPAATRRLLDPLAVVLGWGCWLGAVLLSALPPRDDWRGRATLPLVFAPLGCLLRFYLALWLNGRAASFPLGTFAANLLGTAVLGASWDLAHVPLGGLAACQVLQGVEDGFCGCLTTVSTWAAELCSLRRRHAYAYGGASVAAALAVLVAIMGGLRWTDGFAALDCG